MKITFANEALNKDYEILNAKDQEVITRSGYKGKLSNIPDAATCEELIKDESGHIAQKAAPAKPVKEAEKTTAN